MGEKESVDETWKALRSGKHVVCQVAPSVRVSIGELFGLPPGAIVTGKLVAALRKLGFAKVFDTDFGADLTIMEEGKELLERLRKGKPLLSTSCCPAWINFVERFYPELIPLLSTTKSPQQMLGAIAKTYYAQKIGLKPQDIAMISIMPCTSKRMEAARPEMNASGCRDVDLVLTTLEAAAMMKQAGIDLPSLEPEGFDEPLGTASGAGVIFGTTGGVTEAALRTACEAYAGGKMPKLEFKEVRGFEAVREATVELDGRKIRVAIVHTLGEARRILDEVKKGEAPYDFVEVMACLGGCVGGCGQPVPPAEKRVEVIKARQKAIYAVDASLPVRRSHENPAIKKLYKEFLGEPGSAKAMKLLHTKATPAKKGA